MRPIILGLVIFCGLSCPVRSQTVGPLPEETDYQTKINAIALTRKDLAREYRQNRDKKPVLEKARKFLISSITEDIFPEWFGTAWDFYGTTETPKEGKIACGYFVSTVLRDAGLRISRVSLAQQASENIIRSLTGEKFIRRFSNVLLTDFVAEIKNSGPGLFIVGLDYHVGFIYHDGEEVWFVHSSYVEPKEVIKEKALESVILNSSKYRVTGKISADDRFVLKWLDQTAFPTVRR